MPGHKRCVAPFFPGGPKSPLAHFLCPLDSLFRLAGQEHRSKKHPPVQPPTIPHTWPQYQARAQARRSTVARPAERRTQPATGQSAPPAQASLPILLTLAPCPELWLRREQPCARCVRIGKADACRQPAVLRKRGRPRNVTTRSASPPLPAEPAPRITQPLPPRISMPPDTIQGVLPVCGFGARDHSPDLVVDGAITMAFGVGR